MMTVIWQCLGAIFSYSNLVHAVSGGIGNAFAIAVCFPLESARTRLQVDDKLKAKYSASIIQDIYREEGIGGVYRGLISIAFTLYCGSFVYFLFFHGFKRALQEFGYDQGLQTDLFFGLAAGILSASFTNPLWVINTRLRLQGAKLKTDTYKDLKRPNYSGMFDCAKKIIRYEGFMELWSGLSASLMLVSNPAIQFMAYEALKRIAQAFFQTLVLNGVYYFMFGAISKMIATIVTYPLQLIQTRVRAGYTGKDILNPDGSPPSIFLFLSWYRGLESKLSQTMLTASIMLLSYEKIFQMISFIMTAT